MHFLFYFLIILHLFLLVATAILVASVNPIRLRSFKSIYIQRLSQTKRLDFSNTSNKSCLQQEISGLIIFHQSLRKQFGKEKNKKVAGFHRRYLGMKNLSYKISVNVSISS